MLRQSDPVQPLIRTRRRTKPCPFCAEDIRFEAIKCRFCGEFLYGDRCQSEARFGPEPPDAEEQETDESSADEMPDSDVLWYGRPSVFALTGTAIKASIVIALCYAAYHYNVGALIGRGIALLPRTHANTEPLLRAEPWLDLVALGLIGISLLVLFGKIIALKSIYYEVTPDRIEWSRGIFDRQVDNLDMFRVIDLKLRRSLFECVLGIGTVHLVTKDSSDATFDFVKVRDCRYLYDVIKEAGLEADRTRNVVHLE